MLNPYDPPKADIDNSTTWQRVMRWALAPMPVRSAPEHPLRWLVDALIAFLMLMGGCAVAGFLEPMFEFLGPMSYPTVLVLTWFPVTMWIAYCRVGPHFTRYTILPLLGLMSLLGLQGGFRAFVVLPVAFAITMTVLPLEILVGKFVLSALPGSSRKQEQNHGVHRSTA